MNGDQSPSVDWNDWAAASSPEAVGEDWSDATPLCPRCLNEVGELDHYCEHCAFAVGRFTPYIPFVNIPFMCESFSTMWERLWLPHGESVRRRVLYALLLVMAAMASGYAWILLIAIVLWWRHPQFPPGTCQSCGYDLHASGKRCPECGAVIGTLPPSQSVAPA